MTLIISSSVQSSGSSAMKDEIPTSLQAFILIRMKVRESLLLPTKRTANPGSFPTAFFILHISPAIPDFKSSAIDFPSITVAMCSLAASHAINKLLNISKI